jgi:hypothetical protein
MGWGKISDISVCDSQLIAGGFSLTNVSVYVVDLKKVQPFGNPISSKQIYSRDSPSRYSSILRNVFFYLKFILSFDLLFQAKHKKKLRFRPIEYNTYATRV